MTTLKLNITIRHGFVKLLTVFAIVFGLVGPSSAAQKEPPDLATVAPDLTVPETIDGQPAPGRRVRLRLPQYEGTAVYHVIYLPTDWQAGRRFPVIVEYAGNGGYQNAQGGDVCTGTPEGSKLGYGISGGKGFIWVCVPHIDKAARKIALVGWGDVPATIDYCLHTVRQVCERWGGDPNAVLLTGFSRGAMSCNYIGLHTDRIADTWLGFIPYSFYDGIIEWPGAERTDKASARERLLRLRGRASFVCEEKKQFGPAWINGTNFTKKFLTENKDHGSSFTFGDIPFKNHNDEWVLRDIPERRQLRAWVAGVLKSRPGTRAMRGLVTDAQGKGLAGARVETGETHWTLSGPDGHYVLPGLVVGERTVRISKEGVKFDMAETRVTLDDKDVEGINFKALAKE